MPAEPADCLLSVTGLTKAYDGRVIIADLDLRIETGTAIALTGPNGSGKSTVLRCLSGHESADSIRFAAKGQAITVDSAAYRRLIFPIFDDFTLFADLSVGEHLAFLAGLHRLADPDATALTALEAFGIASVVDHLPNELSSGQARRVAFAAAAIRPWEVLLLDEPEQRLDEEGRQYLVAFLVAQLAAGRGLVLATHDRELTERIGAQVLVLSGPA